MNLLAQCHMSDSHCHTGATFFFFSSIAVSLEIEHPFSANSNISSKKLLGQMNTFNWNIELLEKALLPFYQVIHISVSFVFKKKQIWIVQQSFKQSCATILHESVMGCWSIFDKLIFSWQINGAYISQFIVLKGTCKCIHINKHLG